MHFPRIVRFIDFGLQPKPGSSGAASPQPDEDDGNAGSGGGAVYVHCAMGKSRSATAVIAYLLWKHPGRFRGDGADGDSSGGSGGGGGAKNGAKSRRYPPAAAEDAVQRALALVREARALAEPNPGFMKQLALWWRMGCPADSPGAVERRPAYQRWLYEKDVEESTRIGRAPGRLWFGDEEAEKEERQPPASDDESGGVGDGDGTDTAAVAGNTAGETLRGETIQLRCKMCRRVLAGSAFIVPHDPPAGDVGRTTATAAAPCHHYFVEPLSWMRPVLEEGALEGRLVCPNTRCNALIGRYSWQGFKCTCRAWVCPAFSLQQSKVDRLAVNAAGSTAAGGANPYNIRSPPGAKGPSKV